VRHRAADVPRVRGRAPRRRRAEGRGRARDAAAGRAAREGPRAAQAQVRRRLPPQDGRQGRVPGDRAARRRRRPRPPADPALMAGFLRGEPVELVKGITVGVEVPARAEIVLEGYIEKDEVGQEGPFGDHTGYYTAAEPFPVFHVTAMTMRRDAIYPSIVVGKPPQEDAWLGKATERIFLPAVRTTLPEIVDYDLPVAGVFYNCCIVAIRKPVP